eukprot:scaffold55713_cov52-Attheya_sp.AAC.3
MFGLVDFVVPHPYYTSTVGGDHRNKGLFSLDENGAAGRKIRASRLVTGPSASNGEELVPFRVASVEASFHNNVHEQLCKDERRAHSHQPPRSIVAVQFALWLPDRYPSYYPTTRIVPYSINRMYRKTWKVEVLLPPKGASGTERPYFERT